MRTSTPILRALRDTAMEHAAGGHPDLASMARELGRAIHRDNRALDAQLAPLRRGKHGFRRWLMLSRRQPAVSVLVMAWPVGHVTPVHDHGGLWGLEIVLAGALEVQPYTRNGDGSLCEQARTWLAPGDATWFDTQDACTHRCRNLSRREATLSLHVYGGDLSNHLVYEPPAASAASPRWSTRPGRVAIAGRLSD